MFVQPSHVARIGTSFLAAGCHDFIVVRATPGFIALRHRIEGHRFTFFFNSARTALGRIVVRPHQSARYTPDYFEEAAWRCADAAARDMNLICGRGQRAA